MNLMLRAKNPSVVVAFISCVVAFGYQVLGILGIVVPVTQDMIMQLAGCVITILVALGVLVDPTTAGIKDSPMAMEYTEPRTTKVA